jgi:hypothetical protein
VGISVDEAGSILDGQLANLEELARFFIAHVYSQVLGDAAVVSNKDFVDSININETRFDPAAMQDHYSRYAASSGTYRWSLDATVLGRFHVDQSPLSLEEELDLAV